MAEPLGLEEKLRLEIEKLRCEVRDMSRPIVLRPVVWMSLMSTFLAVGGLIIQWIRSDFEYRLSEVKAKQAELDVKKADAERESARRLRDQLNLEIDHLRRTTAALQAKRDELQRQAAEIRRELEVLGARNDAPKDVLHKLSQHADGLRALEEDLGAEINRLKAQPILKE